MPVTYREEHGMAARGRALSVLAVGGSLAAVAAVGAVGPASATVSAPSTASHVTISVHKTSVGKRVAAKGGRTVYMFSIDTSKKSNCGKKCRAVWKPVTSEHAPKAGHGIKRASLARIKHDQVKYHGHPLYYYIGDHKAGQATGEGLFAFKGFWYTVTAKGRIG
jgi:predicted lipoprotein with Yx(FWY)xxD motif